MEFDFDQPPARAGTHAVQFDERAAKFGRADVEPLWVADMRFATAPCVAAAVAQRAAHPIYGYTMVPESLVAAIIDWHRQRHGWNIERDWIVLTPGTLPALSVVIEALTKTGQGVLMQPPVYGPFASLTQGAGRELVANPLACVDGRYRMDRALLARQVAAGARLLLLCNPHNPVGRVWSNEDLAFLAELTRRHDFTVLSDDIHADLSYRDTRFVPMGALAGAGERIISAVSPCKSFNLQGLALTALVVPDPAQRAAIAGVVKQRHLGNFNPFSLVAAEAAWSHGQPWLDALVDYLQGNRDFLLDWLHTNLPRVHAQAPEAGYLLWLDCRTWGLDDAALRRFFVHDAGLGLNPGTDFGAGGSGHMRLNFAAPRALLAGALEGLARAVHRHGL